MTDEQSVQLLPFIFESKTFAYQRLARGLSRCLSTVTAVIRVNNVPVVKADFCRQYVKDISLAAYTASELIENLYRVFKQIQKAEFEILQRKKAGWLTFG